MSDDMRRRVIKVSIASAVLVLLTVPLAVVGLARGKDVGPIVGLLAIGIGLPIVFGLLMWRQVRRRRTDSDFRRRQPNKAASRVLAGGNAALLLVAHLIRDFSGLSGWQGWALFLVVAGVGSVGIFLIAKQQDPRLHFFRKPDPLPEGQESVHGAQPW